MPESLLDQVLEASSGLPDARGLLSAIIRGLGGLDSFVTEILKDFRALDPGHTNRIRLEQFVITMLERCAAETPGENMDADTLRNVLREELVAVGHDNGT
jgi:hypothetical protein